MRRRSVLVLGAALSVAWVIAAYCTDQYLHQLAIADASAQCADLDEKEEEHDCRERWRAALEKRLPLPSRQLSLAYALAPVPFAWLAAFLGLRLFRRWRRSWP